MKDSKLRAQSLKDVKFDMEKIAEQMKIVERENAKILAGTRVDTSRLHIPFDI